NVTIVTGDGDRQATGTYGVGGRADYQDFIGQDRWRETVRKALDQSLLGLAPEGGPAREVAVVRRARWPGLPPHEAIGHGPRRDSTRKGAAALAGLMGQQIAAPGVTVVDDGTLPARRGSISIDDEGTPSRRTVLIENGRLVDYMQDRLNARLMGMAATGN